MFVINCECINRIQVHISAQCVHIFCVHLPCFNFTYFIWWQKRIRFLNESMFRFTFQTGIWENVVPIINRLYLVLLLLLLFAQWVFVGFIDLSLIAAIACWSMRWALPSLFMYIAFKSLYAIDINGIKIINAVVLCHIQAETQQNNEIKHADSKLCSSICDKQKDTHTHTKCVFCRTTENLFYLNNSIECVPATSFCFCFFISGSFLRFHQFLIYYDT